MKKLVVVALLLLVCGCIGEEKIVCNKPYIHVGSNCCLDINDNMICDIDEATTTTIHDMPKSFQEVFRIVKEHPDIELIVEDYGCDPFTWDRVGPMIRIKDWKAVECSDGGSDEDFCSDFTKGDDAGENEKDDIEKLFGRELEDFYAFRYLCKERVELVVFLDPSTGEIATLRQ